MEKRIKNLMKNYKNLSNEQLKRGLAYTRKKLSLVNRNISFDERYCNKHHLLTDKAIFRDKLKEIVFDLENELKIR